MSKSSFKNTWLGTTTVKNDIGDLGDQITNNWNKTVKTTGNQTINGTKTFTSPVIINNSKYLQRDGNTLVLLELTHQGEKTAALDFIQPEAGFRNYSNIVFRIKNGRSSNFVELLKIQSRNTNDGLYIKAEADKITFNDPTKITNIQNPTADGDAVNKAYVDSKLNTQWLTMVNKTQNNVSTREETWNVPTDFWTTNSEYDVLVEIMSEADKNQTFNFSFIRKDNQNWAISPTFTYSPGIEITANDLKQFKVVLGCGIRNVQNSYIFKQLSQITGITGYKMMIRKRA